ncbi:DedA family protein [Streptomyces apocyni]|uniref:DedA family protein n=1 Tax=Streptomyces apocyni TaxID=2654677 RepID=UPI0012EACECB|nr:DedA family protein [Streptomyces apocyni]
MIDAAQLLAAFGTLGVFVVLFLEASTVFGVVLPGGTTLFTAGVFCAAGDRGLSLPWVLLAGTAGTVLGVEAGYWTGLRAGPVLLARLRGQRLRAGVARVEELLALHGPVAAVLVARSVPVARTLAGPVAGALGVPVGTFTLWQTVAGAAWAAITTLCGYFLGTVLPGPRAYLAVLGVLLLGLLVFSGWRRHTRLVRRR